MGLVGPQNPPDGWTVIPNSAWGTNFLTDSNQVVNGSYSLYVPAYAANAGNSSIQMIGPPIPLIGYSADAPQRFIPRVFLYTSAANCRIGVSFGIYATLNITTPLSTKTLQSASVVLPNNGVWMHRTASVGATGVVGYGRFIISLSNSGSSGNIWIGGVELPRLSPGGIFSNSTAVNVTGGAGFVSLPWDTIAACCSEFDSVTPTQGGAVAYSGILLKRSGLWTLTAEIDTPAALASGTLVQAKIIEGEASGLGTLVHQTHSKVVTQPGGGGVAQTLYFAWTIDGAGGLNSLYDYAASAGGFPASGYPYIVQLSHNDGVNVRAFNGTLRGVFHG